MNSFLKISVLSLVFITSSFAVRPSFAASAKPTGNSGVEDQLKFQVGDESGNEVKALKTELLVIHSEKKALEQLQRLERRYKGTRMEPEILVRLAELYMRRARSERFFEVHKNSDQVLTFAPELIKEASEAKEVHAAIDIYEQIQSKFPGFRAIDVVIFNDAYARQQIGEPKEAERLLFKLIKEHSSSGLVPDAYLAVGEMAFGRRDYSFALENFKAIRAYPESRVYPYGLYKAGWSYYNLQDADSGLKQLEEVVKYGHEMAMKSTDGETRNAKLDLRKEALGDMALFFGDVRLAKDAFDYFKAQSQELDSMPYILKLVEIFKRHGRYADVAIILKDVLAKVTDKNAIASAHEELIWNYEHMKQREQAGLALEAFDKWCDANFPTEQTTKKKPVVEISVCRAKIADASKKLATKWHAQWKKQGGPDDLALGAEKGYRLFLKSASKTDGDLAGIRFAYAELLFARGQFREASSYYALVNEDRAPGVKVDEKLGHDAAYGAIFSLEKACGDKWNEADEKQFGLLSDSYVKNFPKGTYLFDLRFKKAFIAYEKERYDEAAVQLKLIGWTVFPAGTAIPEKVVKAQDLYLDILNIKKDYKGLREAAQSLIGKNTDDARSGQIEKIYREAYFSEIQQKEEKGDLAGAIAAYKKFALENSGSDLAPKAWWNASQLQFRLGDAEGGANTCYEMHKLFPTSGNGKDCLTKAAQTFEAMGRLDLAGRVLLNLSLVEPEQQDHWREVAADFFALSGGKDRAITMYMKLAEKANDEKKRDREVALLEKAAMLAHDTGDAKTTAEIEGKYTAQGIEPQASRLVVEQAEASLERGDLTSAFNTSKRIISRDELPKDLLARARFVQARVLEDEYVKQSVKAKVERLGMVLAIKTEKLEKAQKAYQSAIHYGDPQTSIKALRRLAGCYLDYAKTVRAMGLPEGTSAQDQKAFKDEIEQLSIPMEEKGIESMAQALEASKKAQAHDGQVAELQAEVDRLNMKTSTPINVQVDMPGIYLPHFAVSAQKEAKR